MAYQVKQRISNGRLKYRIHQVKEDREGYPEFILQGRYGVKIGPYSEDTLQANGFKPIK